MRIEEQSTSCGVPGGCPEAGSLLDGDELGCTGAADLDNEFLPGINRDSEGRVCYTLQSKEQPKSEPSKETQSSEGSDFVHVRRARVANWATTWGVSMKRRQIEAKGLPSFKGWKFLTLTIDPSKFDCPCDAYVKGKKRLAVFRKNMKAKGLMTELSRWAWKLEFQENGWPHWHMLLDVTRKYSHEELAEIAKCWGYGLTHTEAVRQDDYLYSFKYAFKPVLQAEERDLFDSESFALPAWFLDFCEKKPFSVEWTDADGVKHREMVEKPGVFSRVRFWQTSKGFYTGARGSEDEDSEEPAKDQQSWMIPFPARAQADRALNQVRVIARKQSGRYIRSTAITVACLTTLWHAVGWATVRGEALALASENYIIPARLIETENKWQLTQIRQENRLSPRRASLLGPRNWKTS